MSPRGKVRALSAEIDAALALLDEYAASADQPVQESFPSLLAQCEAMCAGFEGPEPVRSLHQFACTGGTLIAKCIAALPGVVLLNEIDPLSRMKLKPGTEKPPFAPTDMFIALQQSLRRVDQDVTARAFRAAVEASAAALADRGQDLVIRDHAHSQFCTRIDPAGRQTLHEILAADRTEDGAEDGAGGAGGNRPLLSVVTVRHPLDSFLSLTVQGWLHFAPPTLDEYALRYTAFLDRHAGLPVLKYEAFAADPMAGLQRLCRLLSLPFHPVALDAFRIIRISGDSGRAGARVTPRPRRDVPPEIEAQRGGPAYAALCARMGYDV